MNETEFCSAQSPSPQKYEPNILAKSSLERSPNANLNRDKGDRPACLPYKKTDAVSPFHYKDKDTKWKKQSQFVEPTVEFKFTKAKADRYLDQHTRKLAYVPGAGKYNQSIDQFSKLSRGPSPHYKRGK